MRKATITVMTIVMMVFNIGIPVVFSFCPSQSSTPVCCQRPLDESNDLQRFTTKNPSCCNTSVIADRNTTPFVQSITNKTDREELFTSHLIVSESALLYARVESKISLVIRPPLICQEELIILYSSFLI